MTLPDFEFESGAIRSLVKGASEAKIKTTDFDGHDADFTLRLIDAEGVPVLSLLLPAITFDDAISTASELLREYGVVAEFDMDDDVDADGWLSATLN